MKNNNPKIISREEFDTTSSKKLELDIISRRLFEQIIDRKSFEPPQPHQQH